MLGIGLREAEIILYASEHRLRKGALAWGWYY
jgi:hypothetical protein